MVGSEKLPSIDDLQLWANESELAKENLRGIMAAIASSQEDQLNWGTEALENMGLPKDSDVEWLSTLVTSDTHDIAYWAARLLGRLARSA